MQCIPRSSFVSTKGCMNYHLSSSGKFKNKYICLKCNANLILISYSNGSKIYNGCVDKKSLRPMDSKCQQYILKTNYYTCNKCVSTHSLRVVKRVSLGSQCIPKTEEKSNVGCIAFKPFGKKWGCYQCTSQYMIKMVSGISKCTKITPPPPPRRPAPAPPKISAPKTSPPKTTKKK